jgi:hypothetical protein
MMRYVLGLEKNYLFLNIKNTINQLMIITGEKNS